MDGRSCLLSEHTRGSASLLFLFPFSLTQGKRWQAGEEEEEEEEAACKKKTHFLRWQPGFLALSLSLQFVICVPACLSEDRPTDRRLVRYGGRLGWVGKVGGSVGG